MLKLNNIIALRIGFIFTQMNKNISIKNCNKLGTKFFSK